MNYQALYNEKLQSVAEAVQHIQPGTDIISPLGCAEPVH